MSNRFFCRRRAERFAQLLDEANGARRHHVRTRLDGELSELVQFGRRIHTDAPSVEVDPEFRTGLRALLVATAERDGIGQGMPSGAAPAGPPDRVRPEATGRRRTLRPLLNHQSTRVRARGAIILGVAAGAIAVSGMSAASENALPGDALYGMKRSTERAQLALAPSDLNRGQLFLDFARTRLTEAEALRGDLTGFAAVLDDMDAETRQGVKLLTTAAMQRGDSAPLDAVIVFLDGQRPQVAGLFTAVTTRTERDRADASLDLLDQVRDRADGLRASFSCGTGTGPAPRTDSLGPHPRPCTQQGSPAIEAKPGLNRQEETGQRGVEPTHRRPDRTTEDIPAEPVDPAGNARSGADRTRTG